MLDGGRCVVLTGSLLILMLTKKGHQLSLLLEIHRVLVLKLWLLLLGNLRLLLLRLISSAIEASLVHTVLFL